MPNNLRSRMIRAAYTRPELRLKLLPLIKAAGTTDLKWAAGEIERSLDNLGDVVQVLEARDTSGTGRHMDWEAETSLADDHSEVREALADLRKFSTVLSRHAEKLKRLGR